MHKSCNLGLTKYSARSVTHSKPSQSRLSHFRISGQVVRASGFRIVTLSAMSVGGSAVATESEGEGSVAYLLIMREIVGETAESDEREDGVE